MDLKQAVQLDRLITLFRSPQTYWDQLEEEPKDLTSLLFPQLLLLAVLPAVAQLLGQFFRLAGQSPLLGLLAALVGGLMTYTLHIALWFALAAIIDLLADGFDAQRDLNLSLKLATGTIIPVWLGSTLHAAPVVGHVLGPIGSLAGMIYGCYLLYLGLPVINRTPTDKVLVYTVVSAALFFILLMFLAWLTICPAGCIMASGAPGAI